MSATYAHCSSRTPYATAIDWAKVFFFGDERCVPPDNDQSNYKMAHDAFLGPLHVPNDNIHRMRGEDDPRTAASQYRVHLCMSCGDAPTLDLVMLGMGPDGHTASLFPGTDPLTDDDALVRAVYSNSQQQWRITLTPQGHQRRPRRRLRRRRRRKSKDPRNSARGSLRSDNLSIPNHRPNERFANVVSR